MRRSLQHKHLPKSPCKPTGRIDLISKREGSMTAHIMTPAEVLSTYWRHGTLPVDPVSIAQAAGIEVIPFSPGKCEGASGEYIPTGPSGRPVIHYNPTENINRIRFTVAHELGHHFLRHGRRMRDTREVIGNRNDFYEVSANRFAADILMPKDYVSILINQRNVTSVAELSHILGVSTSAMDYRLKNLGYYSF
ncbi:transcriptional regulator [Komagataeibacter oboediens]|nr:transcriptional regulator [Komagataeibacter oboediens]